MAKGKITKTMLVHKLQKEATGEIIYAEELSMEESIKMGMEGYVYLGQVTVKAGMLGNSFLKFAEVKEVD